MSDPFIAEIKLFGGNFAPRGWAFCDGQLLPINQNSALFSLLGTTYGGDGRTTFGLPDLRGRAAIGPRHGPGLSTYKLGQRGGAEYVTLTLNNLPSHNHSQGSLKGVSTIPCNEDDGDTNEPVGKTIGNAASGTPYNNLPPDNNLGSSSDVIISGSTSLSGGGQSFYNKNPFLAINYIIALVGVFPSRN